MSDPIGTCTCPEILEYRQHTQGMEHITCQLTANVYDDPDSDGYYCECADGHKHYFDDSFLNEFVTLS
jgi:hypothetical protein